MRKTLAATVGLTAAITLALSACGGGAADTSAATSAVSTAAATTPAASSTDAASTADATSTTGATSTAGGSDSAAEVATDSAGDGSSTITFLVAGAPQDVSIVDCVSDPMTQSFTMTGSGGLAVKLPYFPPMLYGESQEVDRLPVNGVVWAPGGPGVLFATGTHAETEDAAEVTLGGEFTLPPSNTLTTQGTPFTLTFSCPVTRS